MNDFQIKNNTILLFRNDPLDEITNLTKDKKNLEDFRHIPLILIPTCPSSGSEYDNGAVGTDKGFFYIAWGLIAEYALLVPKYSLFLNTELTIYSSLVTLIQLCVSIIGDKNPVSYDIGISVIKNALKAAHTLKSNPNDLTARSSVLYGASIATSSWFGLGKEDNFLFAIYKLEIMAEALFITTYRKAITLVFPRLLKFFSKTHEEDIRSFLHDAFGLNGSADQLIDKIIQLFSEFGIDMYFHNDFTNDDLAKIKNLTSLSIEDISSIFKELIK